MNYKGNVCKVSFSESEKAFSLIIYLTKLKKVNPIYKRLKVNMDYKLNVILDIKKLRQKPIKLILPLINKNSSDTVKVNKSISTIKKTILKMKTNSFETIKTKIKKILQESKKDITEIVNDNNNTLAHISVIQGKYVELKIIIESYLEILGRNEEYYNFLMKENDENLTIFDLSAQKGNKEIIKFIYEQISGVESQTIKINKNKNNIFHNAAKK